MSSQYGCVVVCVNVLACGQPKCKQCWTTGQSDFLVRDWLMMLMMSSTSGGSENANLDCFWWRSSIPSIAYCRSKHGMSSRDEIDVKCHEHALTMHGRWERQETWLPDGYSQIFRSYVFGPSGFWTMAPLRYAAKFDPFLSLDCARVEGVGAQSKERKGSNFAA